MKVSAVSPGGQLSLTNSGAEKVNLADIAGPGDGFLPKALITAGDEIQTVTISIPESHAKKDEQVIRMEDAIRQKIATVPGVQSVSFDNGATFTPVQPSPEGGMLLLTTTVPSLGYVSASLSNWRQPAAGPTASIAPQTTGASAAFDKLTL